MQYHKVFNEIYGTYGSKQVKHNSFMYLNFKYMMVIRTAQRKLKIRISIIILVSLVDVGLEIRKTVSSEVKAPIKV